MKKLLKVVVDNSLLSLEVGLTAGKVPTKLKPLFEDAKDLPDSVTVVVVGDEETNPPLNRSFFLVVDDFVVVDIKVGAVVVVVGILF